MKLAQTCCKLISKAVVVATATTTVADSRSRKQWQQQIVFERKNAINANKSIKCRTDFESNSREHTNRKESVRIVFEGREKKATGRKNHLENPAPPMKNNNNNRREWRESEIDIALLCFMSLKSRVCILDTFSCDTFLALFHFQFCRSHSHEIFSFNHTHWLSECVCYIYILCIYISFSVLFYTLLPSL